jgi:1-acyl-sn-glycerol-3-phosphate acyltransferase
VLSGLCLFGVGGAGAALLVTIMATIQRFVPDSRRGRVFGVSDMMTMGAMVAATGLLGLPNIPNLDQYIPMLLLVVAAGLWAAVVVAWREYRRGDPYSAPVRLSWWMIWFYARFWLRMKRIGHCTVPHTGPVIIAANHTAGVDPMVIYGTCPHRIPSFLVAEEHYHVPVAHYFMKLANCVPIDRKNPGRSYFSQTLKVLKEGGCLGIFPQGTFEEPGKESPEAKAGVGLIALRSGATVVPVHISGTKYFDNPFLAYLTRHNMRVAYGKPIDMSAFAGRERDREAARELSDLIMLRIRELGPAETSEAPARSDGMA